jgi:alkylation response protein AidB-like acyl-CoA dehydrogenase
MDLNLTSEEMQFRDELRSWLAGNVPADWAERREESLESRFEYLRSWQRKLFEGGWAGVSWPKQYGGRGANLIPRN